jgi:hypothetical protein
MTVVPYLLAYYFRSGRFAAPLLVSVVGIALLYSQPSSPVLSTAGACAAFLFPAQCWCALSFFNAQSESDRHVLAAAVGGRRLLAGRFLAGAALALFISLLALGYPILTSAYDRGPHVDELGLVLSANLTATIAGTALAALFAQPLVRSRVVAFLGISVCAFLTVPLDLPPTLPVAHAMATTNVGGVSMRLLPAFGVVAGFAAAVMLACTRLWRRLG